MERHLIPSEPANGRNDRSALLRPQALFYTCMFVLTAASLWPIWAVRFLPMQDQPLHLFLSHIVATYDNPSFDWKRHYQVDLGLRPYMLWYLLMDPLSRWFGAEVAGKLTFTLYILLVSALVWVSARSRRSLPWGALLLYPLAFSPIYFMGFSNYVISVPILFLALLNLEEITKRPISLRSLAGHLVYPAILFLNHPYTVLVYLGLTIAIALSSLRDRKELKRVLTPAVLVSLIFVLWYVIQPGLRSRTISDPWSLRWWPLPGTIAYYLLIFTGMRWTNGPNVLVAMIWVGVAALFALSWSRGRESLEAPRWPLVAFVSTFLGFFILPFWLGYWSYFNLRLAPVTYFALALLLSRLRMPARTGIAVAVLSMVLVVCSIRIQSRVSREVEEVFPVVKAMQANAMVLPLMFESSSRTLDPLFFYEFHSHEHDYYHVIVGGGADPDPNFFPNALMPVHYRPGFRPPYPSDPNDFSWPVYGADYDYIVAMRPPAGFVRDLSQYCDLVVQSGPWVLFRNRDGPSSRRRSEP